MIYHYFQIYKISQLHTYGTIMCQVHFTYIIINKYFFMEIIIIFNKMFLKSKINFAVILIN